MLTCGKKCIITAENGMYAKVCLFAQFSGKNLSGSNFSGLGYSFVSLRESNNYQFKE